MSEIVNVAEIFGKNVFNETVMKERLPKSVFKKMKKTIEDGAELDPSIADVVAHACLLYTSSRWKGGPSWHLSCHL